MASATSPTVSHPLLQAQVVSLCSQLHRGHGGDTRALAGGDTLGVMVTLSLFGHKATALLHGLTSVSAVGCGVAPTWGKHQGLSLCHLLP